MRIKLIITAAIAFASCAEPLSSDKNPHRNSDGLASAFGSADTRFTRPWNNNTTIKVCFLGDDAGVGNVTRRNRVWAALQNSWPLVASVSYSDQGLCPSSSLYDAGWVAVYLPENDLCGGYASNGMNSFLGPTAGGIAMPRPDMNIRMCGWADNPDGTTNLEDGFVHEVGHTLGFYHEQERDDSNDCQPGSVNTYGHLTTYDHESVMNYCKTKPYQQAPFMSSLDTLGAEMLYPRSNSGYPIVCESACFGTASGVVMASNGATTIGFIRRGGVVPTPSWTWSGGSASSSHVLASQLSNGTTNLSVSWTAARAVLQPTVFPGETMSASGVAVKSDSQFAAIAMSILN